jgi:hypothetical protein
MYYSNFTYRVCKNLSVKLRCQKVNSIDAAIRLQNQKVILHSLVEQKSVAIWNLTPTFYCKTLTDSWSGWDSRVVVFFEGKVFLMNVPHSQLRHHYIKRWAQRQIAYRSIRWALSTLATKTWIANWKSVPIWLAFTGAKWPSSLNCHFTSGKEESWLRKEETWFSFHRLRHVLYDSKARTKLILYKISTFELSIHLWARNIIRM